ncbi:uncharacterized protein AB9W97_006219 isoform 1-T1 [Spinachia spinachia]
MSTRRECHSNSPTNKTLRKTLLDYSVHNNHASKNTFAVRIRKKEDQDSVVPFCPRRVQAAARTQHTCWRSVFLPYVTCHTIKRRRVAPAPRRGTTPSLMHGKLHPEERRDLHQTPFGNSTQTAEVIILWPRLPHHNPKIIRAMEMEMLVKGYEHAPVAPTSESKEETYGGQFDILWPFTCLNRDQDTTKTRGYRDRDQDETKAKTD